MKRALHVAMDAAGSWAAMVGGRGGHLYTPTIETGFIKKQSFDKLHRNHTHQELMKYLASVK